jgi:hypothetical protein
MNPVSLLGAFVSWHNTEEMPDDFPLLRIDYGIDTADDTFKRVPNNDRLLRASNMGKPVVWHVANAKGILRPERVTVQTLRKFLRGHNEETELISLLRGWLQYNGNIGQVTDTQTVIDQHGVVGHCDLVLRTSSGSLVVDVKTASPYSFERWERRDYNNDYGYISQLAFYREGLEVDESCLLISNKATQELLLRVPPEEAQQREATRNSQLSELVQTLSTLTFLEAYAFMHAHDMLPPPEQTRYRGKPTGNWKPHPTLAYDELRHLIYVVEPIDDKKNNVRLATPTELEERLNAQGH